MLIKLLIYYKIIIIIIISNLRGNLIDRGFKSIFVLERWFNLYDIQHTGYINYNIFNEICELYKLELTDLEKEAIFGLFSSNNQFNYDKFIRALVGNISQRRIPIIRKIFNLMQLDNYGKISIQELIARYNAKRHPDVISRKINENVVKQEFIDMIMIFKEYNENLNKRDFSTFTFQDFCDFYNQFGFGIFNEKYFELMMNNVWNLDGAGNLFMSQTARTGAQIVGGN